jgi:hypothetical protein
LPPERRLPRPNLSSSRGGSGIATGVHNVSHGSAELFPDRRKLFAALVLDGIVEEGRNCLVLVGAMFEGNAGRTEKVRDIRNVRTLAPMIDMQLCGKDEGVLKAWSADPGRGNGLDRRGTPQLQGWGSVLPWKPSGTPPTIVPTDSHVKVLSAGGQGGSLHWFRLHERLNAAEHALLCGVIRARQQQ